MRRGFILLMISEVKFMALSSVIYIHTKERRRSRHSGADQLTWQQRKERGGKLGDIHKF